MTDQRYLEPGQAQLERLIAAAQDDDGPVVMVNLLAFDGAAGRDGYLEYARAVQPHLERVGATLLFAGAAAEVVIGAGETPWWDAVALVRYPSRAAFLEMVSHPDYQAIAGIRSAALTDSALIATTPTY
jgi:uncharacterized protein (DUF1330 family)